MSIEVRAQYMEVDEKGKLRDIQNPNREVTKVIIEQKEKEVSKEEMEH